MASYLNSSPFIARHLCSKGSSERQHKFGDRWNLSSLQEPKRFAFWVFFLPSDLDFCLRPKLPWEASKKAIYILRLCLQHSWTFDLRYQQSQCSRWSVIMIYIQSNLAKRLHVSSEQSQFSFVTFNSPLVRSPSQASPRGRWKGRGKYSLHTFSIRRLLIYVQNISDGKFSAGPLGLYIYGNWVKALYLLPKILSFPSSTSILGISEFSFLGKHVKRPLWSLPYLQHTRTLYLRTEYQNIWVKVPGEAWYSLRTFKICGPFAWAKLPREVRNKAVVLPPYSNIRGKFWFTDRVSAIAMFVLTREILYIESNRVKSKHLWNTNIYRRSFHKFWATSKNSASASPHGKRIPLRRPMRTATASREVTNI